MKTIEYGGNLDHLELWIDKIKNRWEKIPEFQVDPQRLSHLAAVCDGNRRAAKGKGLASFQGHRLGIEVIRGIMRASREWGIQNLTFWTWSTENWQRDEEQVSFVMNLAAQYLKDEEVFNAFSENKARFVHLGRRDRLPLDVMEAITELEGRTKDFKEHTVNLAMDYGGLDEMARAYVKMMKAGVSPDQIIQRPELILNFLDTAGQPLPELVIRTGMHEGEALHTSGFMIAQTTYSAWGPISTLFPDLTPEELLFEIQNFLGCEMRKGR